MSLTCKGTSCVFRDAGVTKIIHSNFFDCLAQKVILGMLLLSKISGKRMFSIRPFQSPCKNFSACWNMHLQLTGVRFFWFSCFSAFKQPIVFSCPLLPPPFFLTRISARLGWIGNTFSFHVLCLMEMGLQRSLLPLPPPMFSCYHGSATKQSVQLIVIRTWSASAFSVIYWSCHVEKQTWCVMSLGTPGAFPLFKLFCMGT